MRKLRLLLILLIISFIGIINVKAVDTSEKVYDFANVLTTEEEELLKEKINKYIEDYNMDMAVVTVRYHNYNTTEKYADEFYDTNEFGIGDTEDGLVCVIDFSKGKTFYEHISTKGNAIIMYDDYRIERILDAIDYAWEKDNTDYYSMFDAFIDKSSYYASLGIPDSNKHVKLDDNGMPYEDIEIPFPWAGISTTSLIISTVIVLILIFRNKMVHKAKNADAYIDNSSINITNRVDQFVTTNTTRVRVSSSSSGGGGGGGHAGGSSFHSSSGGFHGGGGRSH